MWALPSAKAIAILDSAKALMREDADGNRYPVVLQPAEDAASRLGLTLEDSFFLGLDGSGEPVFALSVSSSNEQGEAHKRHDRATQTTPP